MSTHLADTDAFVARLREQITTLAADVPGVKVAGAILEITDLMNAAGLDDVWDQASIENRHDAQNIFCITWMTMLAVELKKLGTAK